MNNQATKVDIPEKEIALVAFFMADSGKVYLYLKMQKRALNYARQNKCRKEGEIE
jgi:hypothetical protein